MRVALDDIGSLIEKEGYVRRKFEEKPNYEINTNCIRTKSLFDISLNQ